MNITSRTHSLRTHSIRHRVVAAAATLLIAGTGLVVTAGPAAAATTPSPLGAGWLTRNAAGATTSWSTTGGKPSIIDHEFGVWTARFPGITGDFGVFAVTPGNQYPGSDCGIADEGIVNGSLEVGFFCLATDGGAVESDFTITYTSISGPNEGWLHADQPQVEGTYQPTRQYNAVGGLNTVEHVAAYPGRYTVTFPGIVASPSLGTMSAIPDNFSQGHCNTQTQLFADHTVLGIACYNRNGVPRDTEFEVHLTGKRAVLATTKPKSGWAWSSLDGALGQSKPTGNERYTSNGKPVTVDHQALGVYVFTFKGLAASTSRGAQAYSSQPAGSTDRRCGAVASASGANAVVTVKCFDPKGKPGDTRVMVDYFGV